MTKFSNLWDTKVSKLVMNCINQDLMQILMKQENELTEEDISKAKDIGKCLKDAYGMYYISDMAWRVEHALADGREAMAGIAIIQVYGVISSESYWQNVFDNDTSSEEAKNILALKDGLKELMDAME